MSKLWFLILAAGACCVVSQSSVADVFLPQVDPSATPGGSIAGQSPAYIRQLPLDARPVTVRPPQQRPAARAAAAPVAVAAQPSLPSVGAGVSIAITQQAGARLPSVGPGLIRR